MASDFAVLLREQARHCDRLGSPLYGELMRRAADDAAAGGVVARVLAGRQRDPRGSMLALRLFGAVHRLVLAGAAPELARYFPSAGGVTDAEAAWPELCGVLDRHAGEIRAQLDIVPQTNEVGRAAALLGGLLHVLAGVRKPVRLREIGASAGLNLRVDAFRYVGADGSAWGPDDAPVRLDPAWTTAPPPDAPVRVVDRVGCDPHPIDATTPEGELRLVSFVWPDQADRVARLRGAVEVARRVPAQLVRAGAAEFLAGLRPEPGTCLVVWHSVLWQYLSRQERVAADDAFRALGAAATEEAPVARVAFEPRLPDPAEDPVFVVAVTTWPGGREVVLGTAPPHGMPVTWYPTRPTGR